MYVCKEYMQITKDNPFIEITFSGVTIDWTSDTIELDISRIGKKTTYTYTPSSIIESQNKLTFTMDSDFFKLDGGRYKASLSIAGKDVGDVYFEYKKETPKVELIA